MSVMIDMPYNGYDAEWHKLEECKDMRNEDRVVCMVCGEDVPRQKFAFGFKVDCPDCGIHLEIVKAERPNGDVDEFLVHYESEKNTGCANEFYERIRA